MPAVEAPSRASAMPAVEEANGPAAVKAHRSLGSLHSEPLHSEPLHPEPLQPEPLHPEPLQPATDRRASCRAWSPIAVQRD